MSPPIAEFIIPTTAALTIAAVHMATTNRSNRVESPPPPYTTRERVNLGRPIISTAFDEPRRSALKRIADETLDAIHNGGYAYKGADKDLIGAIKEAKNKTVYYSPNSSIKEWRSSTRLTRSSPTHISILHITTLDAARLLENVYKSNPAEGGKTGILNFASATKPGGGFRNGADAQEESIARSSTLYTALQTDEAQQFYKLHTRENAENAAAYYSHAMIYSPNITIFRDNDGVWTYPFPVDVLSCAAVNAGEVRKALNGPIGSGLEVGIEKEMSERMGRILFLFEGKGVRNIILGTFGTGVFRNSVATVARIWAHLLLLPDARFKDSFDRIIFAITGEETFADFQSAFDAWGQARATGLGQAQATGLGQYSNLKFW
ncbi:hypothetical protein BYT27DRAFT_7204151 [Phlegmacium glaucopus]|nr:hypothetical protein BYT27DRAFT_7204151 [Phlegmacium glaucopus]